MPFMEHKEWLKMATKLKKKGNQDARMRNYRWIFMKY